MEKLSNRLQHAWNAFMGRDPTPKYYQNIGVGSYFQPSNTPIRITNERTIVNSIYNRISVDAAQCELRHVKVNGDNQYISTVNDSLNECLTLDANKDQTGRALIQDAISTMFNEGVVAIVPTQASKDITLWDSYDIKALRVAKVTQWYPDYVDMEIYNDISGQREKLTLPKRCVALVQNPFYSVMNEPNSTAKRLIRKINLLDKIDEETANPSKMDLIVQIPYSLRSESQQNYAKNRKSEIEQQLTNSRYGIAYIDSTEKVIQLNKSIENTLPQSIKDLTVQLYSQLGITEEILLGTASEEVMLNYYNRTVEPPLSAIVDEMKRKFLTKTARSQKQSIMFFRDPFKLVPVTKIAEIADKFTRNEIMSPNEMRSVIGKKPVADQGADELRNRNLNKNSEETGVYPDLDDYEEEQQN